MQIFNVSTGQAPTRKTESVEVYKEPQQGTILFQSKITLFEVTEYIYSYLARKKKGCSETLKNRESLKGVENSSAWEAIKTESPYSIPIDTIVIHCLFRETTACAYSRVECGHVHVLRFVEAQIAS